MTTGAGVASTTVAGTPSGLTTTPTIKCAETELTDADVKKLIIDSIKDAKSFKGPFTFPNGTETIKITLETEEIQTFTNFELSADNVKSGSIEIKKGAESNVYEKDSKAGVTK